jgi:general secretion pathway protein G
MKRKLGFTLIEILIAVTIIAILTAIGIVSYSSVNRRARDAKRKSDMEQVRSALEIYRNDFGVYPGSAEGFVALTTLGQDILVPLYLPAIPMDPKSTTASPIPYWYSPVGYVGATNFYAYCLCAEVENTQEAINGCPVITPPGTTNYCVYSP